MNVLLIGSGGREHAIALKLSVSNKIDKLFVAPGNPGISEFAECRDIDISDDKGVVGFCTDNKVEFVIIGPEQPIAEGLTDILKVHDIKVFAPSKFAAQLESSKAFAKIFMQRYNIPTAKCNIFDKHELEAAINYINGNECPIVIKADGLAAGKGVIISKTKLEAIDVVKEFFNGSLGKAGEKVVIEEFMKGEEVSVFAICDGKDFVLLPPAQDHKTIGENNTGKNTGGMGAYSPVSIVSNELLDAIKEKIIIPTINGMIEEMCPYIGCLYVGLMICDNEPKVVEYNVRFGDPETQAVVSIFDGDFLELLYTAASGKINKFAYDERNTLSRAACCVIVASQGYPDKYETGKIIEGLDSIKEDNVYVYHAGTRMKDLNLVTAGGRVLGVTAVASDIMQVVQNAYQCVNKIKFDGMYYRRDIAATEIGRQIK